MEIAFKLVITAVVICLIYYQLVFVRTIWKSQLDPKATIARLLEKLKPASEIIARRDPAKIYQGVNFVGEVLDEVKVESNRIVFKRLVNTTSLDRGQPFEYQRMRLRYL